MWDDQSEEAGYSQGRAWKWQKLIHSISYIGGSILSIRVCKPILAATQKYEPENQHNMTASTMADTEKYD